MCNKWAKVSSMTALLQQDFEQDRRTLKAARKASKSENSSCIP
ncbi:hypothetical protein EV13_2549 [Prochlorococcus sp. MIT 0702]|nr:hypothetical protein EV12_2338 [Prochlorococcus sp. MIT 0701]KGG26415.1 hypothetical protein EV13_2549 [Prochlorococcus sp. MIT 0702]KGG31163.1 hypothetical protein EV14_2534 [Prochlorococcus sp. MIT 0703]